MWFSVSFLSNAILAIYRGACLGEALVQKYSTSTGLTEGIRSAITQFQNCFFSEFRFIEDQEGINPANALTGLSWFKPSWR